jgi:two-component system, response regulator PdtaR
VGAKVLIVEDEVLVALQLEDLLTEAGYEVVGIIADRASLRGIDDPPQVALVDLHLRDGPSGCGIAQELAANFGTRVVYVTANPQQIAIPVPTAIGVVQKPFSPQAIVAAVMFASTGLSAGGAMPPPGIEPVPARRQSLC